VDPGPLQFRAQRQQRRRRPLVSGADRDAGRAERREQAAGAVEHLQVAHVRNLADWLAEAKAAGFWIWGADAGAEAAPWSVDLKGPTVLVLGGEGKGIRPRVAAACDGLVALPRAGMVESLNVSAAAAALLFEARRQRG
jgi:23S rRNA (guanosine2251-2'-O)-methyltransferase